MWIPCCMGSAVVWAKHGCTCPRKPRGSKRVDAIEKRLREVEKRLARIDKEAGK